MNTILSLSLEAWRETARQLDIGQAVASLYAPVAKRLPITGLWVHQIQLQPAAITCVAAMPATQHGIKQAAADIQPLITWCRPDSLFIGDAAQAAVELPGLVPDGLTGVFVAAPLFRELRLLGILMVHLAPDADFTPQHQQLFRALLEPYAIALDNHLVFRELKALREAAEADNRSLRVRLDRQDISESVIGAETGLRDVIERLDLVGPSDTPVLILGETGSGKEVVARHIHTHSRREHGPFLRVNCGAIPPELIDSHLFGHERGSFSGADTLRKGWFERADNGTLFLDEIGELPLAAQVRLLRILQDGTFERVGGQRQLRVNVRIIAATHRDLRSMVSSHQFREDLWYRIAVFPIAIPPLRDRREDIPALAAHFALRAAKRLGAPPLTPTAEDTAQLMTYQWPGNVRELAAVIERAAILGNGQRLEITKALGVTGAPSPATKDPPTSTSPPTNAMGLLLNDAIRQHIEAALQQTHGRVEGRYGAARLLGINPQTLRAKMRKLGINWKQYRTLD